MVTPCLYYMHICTYTMLIRVMLYSYISTMLYFTCSILIYYTSKGYTIWRLLYWHVYIPLYYVLYMILLYSTTICMKVTLLACVYTSKAWFYSCIVNFITITLYVPETLAILVFHTYKYTYFKHCKYSSTPCNSK